MTFNIVNVANRELGVNLSDSKIKVPVDVQAHNLTDSERIPVKNINKPVVTKVFDNAEITSEGTKYSLVDLLEYKRFTLYFSTKENLEDDLTVSFQMGIGDKLNHSFRVRTGGKDEDGVLITGSARTTLKQRDLNQGRFVILNDLEIFQEDIIYPESIRVGLSFGEVNKTAHVDCYMVGVKH